MKATVVGLGHVGTVAAVSLAASGHEVLATDVDPVKAEAFAAGVYAGYEPGLVDRLRSVLGIDNIRFRHRDDVDEDLGEVAIIAVGTPPGEGYAPELGQVRAAIRWVRERCDGDSVVVMKSTVPPGTGNSLIENELHGTGIGYASNPDFLRAGQALTDWDCPNRIVFGTAPGDSRSLDAVRQLYSNMDAQVLCTDITTAELIKYASNAFLATRISFINEMAAICDRVGASIDDVSEGLALDTRTGARIFAGVGYGGPCLPEDIGALEYISRQVADDSGFLRSVISVNDRQCQLPLHALRDRFNGDLHGLRVAILGLTFKPGTGDLTEAPALKLARILAEEGAILAVYDSGIGSGDCILLPDGVRVATDVVSATSGTQAAVVMTEWKEIVEADWLAVSRGMVPPKFIFDGRKALVPTTMRASGFEYVGVGRGSMSHRVLRG